MYLSGASFLTGNGQKIAEKKKAVLLQDNLTKKLSKNKYYGREIRKNMVGRTLVALT
jgi:hypothetical protein